MKVTHTPKYGCPHCGKELDAASGAFGDLVPKPGDISVCIGCSGLLVFGDKLRPRRMLQEEIDALSERNRAEIGEIIRAVAAVRKRR